MRVALTLLVFAAVLSACTSVGQAGRGAERGPAADLQRFEYTQVHMGVQARLVLYAPDSSAARRGAGAAFDRIADLDKTMSDYRVDSELMELVRRAGEGPVRVSVELFEVMEIAQRIARQSGGAFDITIGPLVHVWREARRIGRLPAADELSDARSRVGADRIRLYPEKGAVELVAAPTSLDLGGIAKGYAADAAIATLRASGITRALIEFGGDIVVGDPPPGLPGWRISVPLEDASAVEMVLANQAVSTSGDTQQFVEIDGTRYSHVVDPRTGLGLTSHIAVTVVAPRGVLSDALSTALSVMGPEAGRRMTQQEYPEIEVFFRQITE